MTQGRFLRLGVLLVLLVALGACTVQPAQPVQPAAEQPAEGAAPEEAAQPEAAAAECQLGVDAIRIGGQGALSGSHADYGRQMEMGATLAAEEINAAGGIMGCPVETRYMDSELNADEGIRNARFLVNEWGADFLVGVDSSGVALALAPVMEELQHILIVTHGATEKLTEQEVYAKGNKYVFRMSVPVYQDSIVAALVFKDKPEMKRFANIGADYEYGHTAWEMFQKELSKYRDDVEFVGEAWAPFRTADFTPHISTVMAEDPDVIFATPWAGEAVTLLRQAQSQGVFDQIDAWWQAMGGSIDVLEGVGNDVRNDAFQGKLWATARYIFNYPDTERNHEFVAAFQDRWSRLPNYSAQTTYSAIYALKQAIEEAGTLDTPAVIDALEGMQIEVPAGNVTIRAEDHQAVYNVPAGRVVWDDDMSTACVCADLQIFDAEEYYRNPPFSD
jgi:branched-chain amino acid transport system substrate-binding protein